MTTETIKTTTLALMEAWDEFNNDINGFLKERNTPSFSMGEYTRMGLFKMMVKIETSRGRTNNEVF